MQKVASLLTVAAILGIIGCDTAGSSSTSASRSAKVVYGDDNRHTPYEYSDQAFAHRAVDFTAALVYDSSLTATDDGYELAGDPLTSSGVCADERFATLITPAFCSGTLVDEDLVLTAGHCVTAEDCAGISFVFGFRMSDADTLAPITSDQVYHCAEVVVNDGPLDYSVVRLDRSVVGRTPAPVDPTPVTLAMGDGLIMTGHPSGLPLIITDQAVVRNPTANEVGAFSANLDAFSGNSGSGVYRADTGVLVGVLVAGEQDYQYDRDAGCMRVNQCANDGCRGETVKYASHGLSAVCEAGGASFCVCGDGSCEASDGETTATCPRDCGSLCGDGTCNGDETHESCMVDCGICGNGLCDGDETSGSCCADCGCDGTDQCFENECRPDPGAGNECATAETIVLAANETQTREGETRTAFNNAQGSCLEQAGNDRVYALEVSQRLTLTASVAGYDTVLYVRGACGDAESELSCDDDNGEDLGSRIEGLTLTPGTYYIFVDGFETAGDYTLVLETCAGAGCGMAGDAGTETEDGGTDAQDGGTDAQDGGTDTPDAGNDAHDADAGAEDELTDAGATSDGATSAGGMDSGSCSVTPGARPTSALWVVALCVLPLIRRKRQRA